MPAVEAIEGRLPGAEPFGQIAPGASGVEDPEAGVNHRAMVAERAPLSDEGWEQILDQDPLLVRDLVAAHPCSSRGESRCRTSCRQTT